MNIEVYRKLVRIAAGMMAVMFWGLSVYFSQGGFGVAMPEMAWIGWVLALGVTVIEIVWNIDGFGHNLTLMIIGLAAYAYGVWSNIIGIMAVQGVNINEMDAGWLIKIIFPVLLGIALEIAPEPLLLWSFVGAHQEDLLSNVFNRVGEARKPVVAPIMRTGSVERPAMSMPQRIAVSEQREEMKGVHVLGRRGND